MAIQSNGYGVSKGSSLRCGEPGKAVESLWDHPSSSPGKRLNWKGFPGIAWMMPGRAGIEAKVEIFCF